jgi:hypothetical protein
LRFGLICAELFGASGGEFKVSLAAVNKQAAWSVRLGVVSATLSGIKYLSLSLDKSYVSKND